MKILHTSDWHLGQSFMGRSRAEEHQLLISWLLDYVTAANIEAVILAGDVFDTSTPPSYARELYLELVLALYQRDCALIVVAGNHDSVSVLNESKSLLKQMNTYVITQPSWDQLEASLVTLKNRAGERAAMVCAVPFLRVRDMVQRELGQSIDAKQAQLSDRIQAYYRELYEQAKQMAEDLPIIGTGHLTVLGGHKTESVRDIYVGTLEALPPALLPEFDYLALGHIHKPMGVGGKEVWRYSGSPIPMSFDESGTQKSVAVFDTENKNVNLISIPNFRELRSLKGSRDELVEVLAAITNESELCLWLDLTLTDDINIGLFQEQVSELLEGKNIEVLKVQRLRKHINLNTNNGETATLEDVTPQDVFAQLLEEKQLDEDHAKHLAQMFNTFIDENEAAE